MEEKNEIENYLKNMYEFYKKNNYHFFVEKCLSFNIKTGEYNKSINNLSKKIYTDIFYYTFPKKSRENPTFFYFSLNNNQICYFLQKMFYLAILFDILCTRTQPCIFCRTIYF